jgi:diguanylate cyclase (GGDEF)-like protein
MPLITRDGQKLVWSYTNRLLRDAGKSAYVLGHAQDVTERLEMQKALLKSQRATLETERRLSRTDGLTGAANRRAFYETAEVERKRALRYGRPMSLAYIDLDNFKQVNDQSGHDSGDRVLVCVAEVLRKHNRAENLVARLGGDEFALLLPEAGQISAGVVINKLRGLLNNAMRENGWPVTFSIGVVTYDKPPENMEEMVQVADKLMYTVKREGKNKIGCSVVTLGQSNQSVHLSAAAQTEDAAAGARMTQNLPIDHQGTRA